MVRATATLTLALPKRVSPLLLGVGEVYCCRHRTSGRVYAELGIEVPALFEGGQVIRPLRPDERPTSQSGHGDRPLAWRTPADAVRLIFSGATFATAARIALVVGTLL